jgi:hypothetical protein
LLWLNVAQKEIVKLSRKKACFSAFVNPGAKVSPVPSKNKDLVLEKAGVFLLPWLEASTAEPPAIDNPSPIIVLYQILLRSKFVLHHHDKP